MYKIKGKIDSSNAAEFEKEILEAKPTEIDASQLEYISSAGLRVLLKLRKTVGELTIFNVSIEVYEIFDVTGFTSILNIKKALREISVEGKEILGKGGNGTVYRLDDDTIVKVYGSEHSLEIIDRERAYAKAAFVAGIPTAIAFDTVKVGDNYGVIYEAMNSDTLGHAIMNEPEHRDEYIMKYSKLAKKLHSTTSDDGSIDSLKNLLKKRADNPVMLELCTREEVDTLKDIVDSMAECDTLVYGYLHPGNIMINNGELMLIDMGELTRGLPVYDIASIYRDLMVGSKSSPETTYRSIGIKPELCAEVGQKFIAMYTGITDKTQFEQYMKMIGLVFAFNVVLLIPDFPGAAERGPAIIDQLLRGAVLPNVEALKQILSK